MLHRQQQSVFLIFWAQNLVKGLPLRQLLNPSGPIWSYLRGIRRQWTGRLCEGPSYVSSSVGRRRRHNQQMPAQRHSKCQQQQIRRIPSTIKNPIGLLQWCRLGATIGRGGDRLKPYDDATMYHSRPADDNNPESF